MTKRRRAWRSSAGFERVLNVHYGNGIVIEDSRDVFGGELVCCVADEKTCLAHSTVSDDDAPRVTASAGGRCRGGLNDGLRRRVLPNDAATALWSSRWLEASGD